jgi:hypothetical protein
MLTNASIENRDTRPRGARMTSAPRSQRVAELDRVRNDVAMAEYPESLRFEQRLEPADCIGGAVTGA